MSLNVYLPFRALAPSLFCEYKYPQLSNKQFNKDSSMIVALDSILNLFKTKSFPLANLIHLGVLTLPSSLTIHCLCFKILICTDWSEVLH